MFLFLIFTALFGIVASAFDAAGNDNVVIYWGQNSAGGQNTQENLAYYCQFEATDVVVLSFLTTFFGTGGLPEVNFAGACSGPSFPGSQLFECDQIAADIKTCQGLGKKVLLSLGGAVGQYGFTDDTQAEQFADTIWNVFGGGSSDTRPFGDSIVDGFDLDIENNNPTGYAAFVTQMRTHYTSDGSKPYYISGAPQCPLPDYNLNTAIVNSAFDFIFVQFYNNYCGMQNWLGGQPGTNFNYDGWDTFVRTQSFNKNAKVYLGVPASASAAGSGYQPASVVGPAAQYLQATYSTFGGIMMWDASQAWANVGSDGRNFAQDAKAALSRGSASEPVSSSSSPVISTAVPPPPISSTTSYTPAISSLVQVTTSSSFLPVISTSILSNSDDLILAPSISASSPIASSNLLLSSTQTPADSSSLSTASISPSTTQTTSSSFLPSFLSTITSASSVLSTSSPSSSDSPVVTSSIPSSVLSSSSIAPSQDITSSISSLSASSSGISPFLSSSSIVPSQDVTSSISSVPASSSSISPVLSSSLVVPSQEVTSHIPSLSASSSSISSPVLSSSFAVPTSEEVSSVLTTSPISSLPASSSSSPSTPPSDVSSTLPTVAISSSGAPSSVIPISASQPLSSLSPSTPLTTSSPAVITSPSNPSIPIAPLTSDNNIFTPTTFQTATTTPPQEPQIISTIGPGAPLSSTTVPGDVTLYITTNGEVEEIVTHYEPNHYTTITLTHTTGTATVVVTAIPVPQQ